MSSSDPRGNPSILRNPGSWSFSFNLSKKYSRRAWSFGNVMPRHSTGPPWSSVTKVFWLSLAIVHEPRFFNLPAAPASAPSARSPRRRCHRAGAHVEERISTRIPGISAAVPLPIELAALPDYILPGGVPQLPSCPRPRFAGHRYVFSRRARYPMIPKRRPTEQATPPDSF